MAPGSKKRLRLGDVIDLELQLDRDRHANEDYLRKRDAEIGAAIDARELDGRPLFLGWLSQIRRRSSGDTAGIKIAKLIELISLTLFVLGLILGAGAVAPWLAYDTERPVNVIFFWSALVGTQIFLLVGWLIAICPRSGTRWIPGVSALQTLLRALGKMLPAIVTWIASKCSREIREALTAVRGQNKRLEWLYGRLAVWQVVGLTQAFAVAFNVGAVAAFVALSYGNDPSFGWKSTLMTDKTLHRAVRVIAAPWSSWDNAVPSLEEIEATRYSSLEDRFVGRSQNDRSADVDLWASWWPFLLASLLVYGLAPRILTWLIALGAVQKKLSAATLDHREFQKLADRLRRPLVDTRATTAEDVGDDSNAAGEISRSETLRFGGASAPILTWAGVELDRAQLEQILRSRFDLEVQSHLPVGRLDQTADSAAIDKVRADTPQQVVLVVEAWEPPVADYRDFIQEVRQAVGDGVSIVVLLYNRDVAGVTTAPQSDDLQVWQKTIAAIGDPWTAVEPLMQTAAVGNDATKESDG